MKWGIHFDLVNKKEKVEEIEAIMQEPNFWDSPEKSQNYMKELKNLKDSINEYEELKREYEDVETLLEMGYEMQDASLIPEVEEALNLFVTHYERLHLETLLSGEYDGNNAILTLHAGAGGTESCDWASMLCRMYQRFADKKGFTTEMIDFLDGDEAGYKSVTLEIKGLNAYGYLKSERGVHRLVRISPFNAAGKRQTSFVSCDVMPDIEEDLDIEIDEGDLRIDHPRGSRRDYRLLRYDSLSCYGI